MGRDTWYDILKVRNIPPLPPATKEEKVRLTYENFKRRNPHIWEEARQLPGNGEVAALDSIIMEYLNETITDAPPTAQENSAMWKGLTDIAEGFIFSN
jgi:hypothetical protein